MIKKRRDTQTPVTGTRGPLDDGDIDRYAEILKALANQARLRIVNLLVLGEMSVTQICERTGLKQSLVSQQLKILRLNDIVQYRKEVPHAYYSLKERNVVDILGCLNRCCSDQKGQARR
jgi:DNA-binding transcriptional ArsR family regulator